MAGGFRAVVPGAVDARGRGDVLVDVVFGARGRQRALVGDEPGEQAAAPAFDLRVDAPLGRGRADHGVGFEVAELMARVHLLRPARDRHAHRNARPLRPPALRTRAVPLAARQVLPEVQRPLRFRVDPLVEAFVADAHARVGRVFGFEPAFDAFGRPSLPERVQDPCEQRVVRHAPRSARSAGAGLGLPRRGHGRIERTARPRPRLQAFRPVRPVRVVLIGREPQSAFQFSADRGLVAADPQRYLAHAEPVPVAQFVDSDLFLCRQVGISFHIERSTFSSVVDLNTSNHRQVLRFYLELRLSPKLKDIKEPVAGMDWSFAQWFPHFVPHSGQNAVRTMAVRADDLALRISELTAMLDERSNEQKRQSIKHWVGSAVVIIMEHAHVLRSMPGIIRLLQEGPALGIYALCIDTDERLLPEECQTVITATTKDLRVESNKADDVFDIMPDLVSQDWLGAVANALAPIEDGSPAEGQSAIPDHSRLLDLLDLVPTPEQIEARWEMYPHSTACVIGESVDGSFDLDISKDGPHGLIGGTTGSGKSELLQSLVASLAVANTPQAMNFVLVDYKGGAAFKDCVQLPHTVGMVTDLDNHLVSRALVSLGAELNYREHLLAQVGAKDLEDYIDMRESKPSIPEIPRLLIVIDEFASLARELPDFVTGLVNIAQRGRSLGIHLILATQRPGGVVSPEIRVNTNLRIALRMTDVAESQDVIDAKDAALISKSTPGRAVVRLGSSSLIPFQSARVGGRYIDPLTDKTAEQTRPPFIRSLPFPRLGVAAPQRPKSKKSSGDVNVTDLKKLVDAINEAARREHIPQQRQPWLPALSERVELSDLQTMIVRDTIKASAEAEVSIPFAIGDYPQEQRQSVVSVELSSLGNMFIVGTSRSGKSTALRTIAYSASVTYSPEYVHIYCIDGGNGAIAPLQALPNVGVVALRSETQKIERLMSKLEAECKRRSSLLSRDGYSSIDEYNLSSKSSNGRLPHIIIMLDSWDGFNSVFQNYDGGSLIDRIQILMREGASSGIHFIVTGDHSLLLGRMSVLAGSKVLLRLIDSTDYTEVGMSARDVPDEIPDGRGYRSEDSGEIQIAKIRKDSSGQEESELIRATGVRLRATRDHDLPKILRPFTVEQLPDEITLSQVYSQMTGSRDADLSDREECIIPLGVGGEDNEPILFDPKQIPVLPIYGTPQSGKTTMLVTIVNGALLSGYHVIIAAPKNNAMRSFVGMDGVECVATTPVEITEDLLNTYVNDSRALFIFDDCQLLKDIPASNWIMAKIGMLEPDNASFVFAGDTGEFPSGFGNWASKVKTIRQGVLLKPENLMDQDLINIKIRRSQLKSDMPVGRGFAHLGVISASLQGALSEPSDVDDIRRHIISISSEFPSVSSLARN